MEKAKAKVIGLVECHLCKARDAELRENVNGRVYICCAECVSLVRTSSRKGDRAMRAMLIDPKNNPVRPEAGEGAQVKEPVRPVHLDDKPVPKSTETKKSVGLSDVARMMGGGS